MTIYYNYYEVKIMAKNKRKDIWKKVLVWAMLIAMVASLFTYALYALLS